MKNWYAVITADVLYSKDLTARQKILCAVIANMSNEKGYCFATNKYFAEMMDCSTRTIQEDLRILENLEFIGRVIKLNEKGEVEYRALTPMRQIAQPHANFRTTPHATDCAYNNKDINNKSNIDTAYDYLKEKISYEIEVFEMQNKKDLGNDWERFIINFNSKVIEESIYYEPNALFARLTRLRANWKKEKEKYSAQKEKEGLTDNLTRAYNEALRR